ncbi:MAG TPA: ABC transporter substrate-binding protein, partial [Sphingomicrobium sp.]|nr:ABC transporter substrate-binding protein [Sphingomicrobium sp.]
MKGIGTVVAATAIPTTAMSEERPIKIGLLTIRTGFLAAPGKQLEDGVRVFLNQRNGMIAGRRVELLVADTAGLPAQTLTKARELIERDKIDVLIGPLAAGEALAANDYLNQSGTPTIIPAAAAEDLTQRKAGPWLVRVSGASAQFVYPLADYAAKELKYKRIGTIADDLAYGHEAMSGFMRVFEESGGKVVQKLWPPFNAADYGTYIAQVKGDLDALLVGLAGQNGPKFLRQWSEFGFKGKLPL